MPDLEVFEHETEPFTPGETRAIFDFEAAIHNSGLHDCFDALTIERRRRLPAGHPSRELPHADPHRRVARTPTMDTTEVVKPYCTGDRCADCKPDEECCEATCGCCPRVNEQDWCWLRPGSEDDSKYCSQHGEGSLYDRSPEAERMYEILRRA